MTDPEYQGRIGCLGFACLVLAMLCYGFWKEWDVEYRRGFEDGFEEAVRQFQEHPRDFAERFLLP